MARTARLILPGYPHHIYHQGNNYQAVFLDDEDRAFYLERLRDGAREYQVDIHAYALLERCLYLLATPADATGLARMMQWMGRCYVPYVNRKYHRSGTLWEGRFRTSIVETDQYLMRCSRFIEMRPVMAGLVENPHEYRWSSYQHHVGLHASSLVRDHVLYWNLGNTPFDRESAYLAFVREFSQDEDTVFERAVTKGWPLGSKPFIQQLEALTGHPFRMGRRGRPTKKTT